MISCLSQYPSVNPNNRVQNKNNSPAFKGFICKITNTMGNEFHTGFIADKGMKISYSNPLNFKAVEGQFKKVETNLLKQIYPNSDVESNIFKSMLYGKIAPIEQIFKKGMVTNITGLLSQSKPTNGDIEGLNISMGCLKTIISEINTNACYAQILNKNIPGKSIDLLNNLHEFNQSIRHQIVYVPDEEIDKITKDNIKDKFEEVWEKQAKT